jgi:DNA helicase IV
MPIGRPPMELTPELATAICDRLEHGETLRSIVLDPLMPSRTTIFKWLQNNDAFAEQYARARDAQADHFAEEIVDIADAEPSLIFKNVDGVDVASVDSSAVNLLRLRIDARKWYASKVAPKKYGDKIETTHRGDVTVNTVNYAGTGKG